MRVVKNLKFGNSTLPFGSSKVRAACAARLVFLMQPIIAVFTGVVFTKMQ